MNKWVWNIGVNTCKGQATCSEKTCPSVPLATTNSTLSGLELNLGLHRDRQVTCWATARRTCISGFSLSADVHTDTYSALETVCTAANRHVFRSHHKNTGQKLHHQDGNKSLQNVAQFKHSGMALTNQNCIHEEIKKDDSDNACYHLVQNLLLSHLLIQENKD